MRIWSWVFYRRLYSIEDYIPSTVGFPAVDGSSGINLKVVEFSASLDPYSFDIEEIEMSEEDK